MTTTPTLCLECNAPLSPAETQGLCARCLLKMGLASQFGETSVADAGVRKFIAPPMFPFDFGEYRVLRLLGRGGMGAVYEAEQRDTGRRVALKVLGHTIDSPEMRARFMREGRLAASVNHPNSVYIFGTEEIEGAPVIAMELVAGGTLRDRIRKGPLPVREAVDAILQVIAGLEAAANAGVLHRDVKPANCFVAPDGTAKVGDFGLSVSTLARNDTQLTASGVMLGTPSFAPPEQLRGDELDVRADIYSVGATLYALLTGRAPFEGGNAVQVVAAVLDKMPPPIANIPAGLAQIVARCLAKKRDDRFADYAALRDALLPFSASVPEPAPLGLRVVAGVIDNAIAFLPNTILTVMLGHDLSTMWASGTTLAHPGTDTLPVLLSTGSMAAALRFFGTLAFAAAYFAGCEGRWGATPAKALCGLRVVGPDGGAPGFARSFLRVAIYLLLFEGGAFLHAFFGEAAQQRLNTAAFIGFSEIGTLIFALLFVTMRRHNGFAALHELASGTRTIARAKVTARPRLDVPAPATPDSTAGERLGPYRVLGPLADGTLLAGYDEVLRRHVWIRPCAAGAPALDVARREIGRAARLRWIGGARSDAANWDAFEAPPGKPLRELSPQPWSAVRGWLHDLAEEIDAASKDGTLPAQIGVDHVWITADGRAELLDEAWPSSPRAPLFACAEPAGAQHFLTAVADSALDRTALPLHARAFLDKLAAGAFDRVSFILGNLQSLLAKPASVSRRRRFAALALLPGAAVFASIVMGLMMIGIVGRTTTLIGPHAEEWLNLNTALKFYAAARGEVPTKFDLMPQRPKDAKTAATAEAYISAHFGELIHSPTFDQDAKAAGLTDRQRELAQAAVAAHPTVSPEQLAEADEALSMVLGQMEGFTKKMMPLFGVLFFASMLLFLGVGSLLSGPIFGVAPMLQVFGLAAVDRAGRPASRLRLLARTALVWGPFVAGWFAIVLMNIRLGSVTHSAVWNCGIAFFAISALGFLIGVPWTVLRRTAGPHDRLAGTRVVPR